MRDQPANDEDFDFDAQMDQQLPDQKDDDDKPEEETMEEPKDEEEPKEDDDFSFGDEPEPKPKKVKKTKEDSMGELRRQRDEARKFQEAAKDLDPESITLIRELISEDLGDDLPTKDRVEKIIIQAREQKKISEELEQKIKEQENRIKDLDIRSSEEFNKEYIEPLQQRASDLYIEIANLDDDGKAIAPEATKNLHQSLLKEKSLDSTKVKQLLTKFAKDFKEESGEDYTPSSVSAVMNSYRLYSKANETMGEAFNKWDSKKKETLDKQRKEESEQQEFQRKENKLERRTAAIQGMRSFDLESIKGFKTKKDLEGVFRETYAEHEKIFDNPTQTPDYTELMKRSAKARMFDELASQYQELLEWKNSQEEEDESIAEKQTSKKKKNKEEEDWLKL